MENLERFFDPAFTTQGGGVGKGSTFRVELLRKG